MLKRLCLALAGLFAFVSFASGAGTVPAFSLTPQFDLSGKVAPGCKLYIIQAGTTSTPQNAYQDSGLTILQPNPMTCDAGGRLGQFFVADGTIKLRLTDKNGVQLFVGDNLMVVGPSGGGGGGGTVDPTTIIATGDFKLVYNTGVLSGFVRCNGRTIGNATSGATERANADTSALFAFLWSADVNLSVSGGRGANSAADYAANKTITLPDCRGRALAGLDDMGNSAASRLTTAGGGVDGVTLGAAGGTQNISLAANQIPTITASNASQTITVNPVSNNSGALVPWIGTGLGSISWMQVNNAGAGSNFVPYAGFSSWNGTTTFTAVNSISTTYTNASQVATKLVQPTIVTTIYIKL